jgi:hypothetical protein
MFPVGTAYLIVVNHNGAVELHSRGRRMAPAKVCEPVTLIQGVFFRFSVVCFLPRRITRIGAHSITCSRV